MSDQPMPPLPPEVEALLAAERHLPAPPPGLEASVWEGLGPALGTVAGAASTGAASGLGAGLLKGKLIVGALAFVLGGTTVAIVDRTVLANAAIATPPPPPPPSVLAPAPVAPPAVEREVPPPPPTPPPARALPPQHRTVEPELLPSKTPTTLADERAIIEVARTALARGRTADALTAANEHERRFPTGQLAEDRDFIRLQALGADGQLSEVKRRTAEFRARYPSSLLLPAVDELLQRE